MKMSEIKAALDNLGILEYVYVIGDACRFAEEQYCIRKESDTWIVYYSERGHRNDESTFFDENSACQYFINLVKTDRSVYKNNTPIHKN